MIVFHEGLPRSGKSYEAIVAMVDWLKSGKKIYTNIAGINHEKFSELTSIPVSMLMSFLIQISNDDVRRIWEVIPLPDSDGNGGETDLMIVIDELQDFFPSERQKPNAELSTWVASHGHAGWHILALGQDMRDCHNLWRRRVQRKIVFTKQTAVGLQHRYKWEAYEASRPEKFKAIGAGSKAYDKKYFGSYASHVSGTGDTGALMDDRTIVWKRPGFKYGIPLFFVAAFFAIDFVVGFFDVPEVQAMPTSEAPRQFPVQPPQSLPPVPHSPPPTIQQRRAEAAAARQTELESYSMGERYLLQLSDSYRPRLVGFMSMPNRFTCLVVWMDNAYRVQEQLTCDQITDLGFSVKTQSYGIELVSRDQSLVVTSWPVEPFGSVSRSSVNSSQISGL